MAAAPVAESGSRTGRGDAGRGSHLAAPTLNLQLAFRRELRSAAQRGDTKTSEAVISKMQSRGIAVLLEDHNMLLHAYARGGGSERAQAYLSYMECKGMATDQVSYNTVVNACVGADDLKGVHMWLDKMSVRGIPWNIVTYGTLCKAYSRKGCVKSIEVVIDQLDKDGIEVNEYFYRSLVYACGSASPPDTQRAEQALFEVISRGLRPDSIRGALTAIVGRERFKQLLALSHSPDTACIARRSDAETGGDENITTNVTTPSWNCNGRRSGSSSTISTPNLAVFGSTAAPSVSESRQEFRGVDEGFEEPLIGKVFEL